MSFSKVTAHLFETHFWSLCCGHSMGQGLGQRAGRIRNGECLATASKMTSVSLRQWVKEEGAQQEESQDGLTEKHACTQPQGNWKSEAHSLILWAPAECQLGVGPCAGARGVVINETPPSSSPLSLRAN